MTSSITPVTAASNGGDTTTSERERPEHGLPELREKEGQGLISLGVDALNEASQPRPRHALGPLRRERHTASYPQLQAQLAEALTCLETAEHYLFMLGSVFEEHANRNRPPAGGPRRSTTPVPGLEGAHPPARPATPNPIPKPIRERGEWRVSRYQRTRRPVMCRPSCCKPSNEGAGIAAVAVIAGGAFVAVKIGPIVARISHLVVEVLTIIMLTAASALACIVLAWLTVAHRALAAAPPFRAPADDPAAGSIQPPEHHIGRQATEPGCLACGDTGTVLRAIGGSRYQAQSCPACEPATRAG